MFAATKIPEIDVIYDVFPDHEDTAAALTKPIRMSIFFRTTALCEQRRENM